METILSRHIVIRSPSEPMREQTLTPGGNIIGRDPNCQIQVFDSGASRQHANIIFDVNANSMTIMDLDSTNGTFINSKKIKRPHKIEVNDILRIGRYLIGFRSEKTKYLLDREEDFTKTIVTGELMIESIDNYSTLIHDIAMQLVDESELSVALEKISALVKQIIGADKCSLYMLEQIPKNLAKDIPVEIFNDLVADNVAALYGSSLERSELSESNKKNESGYSLVCPVIIGGKAVAIITAKKSESAIFLFNNNDLQIVIAISHQAALVIQRNELEAKLIHNATHDNLTGLFNRSMLINNIDQALQISKRRKNYSFAVLFLDIDNFKLINDNHGHLIGDKLLVELSERINKLLRKTDTLYSSGAIARFGGDEFAILLCDLKDALDPLFVAQRVSERASEPFSIDGKCLEISLSIGLATNNLKYEEPEEILRDADIAMYRAKKLGKNRIELYDKEFHIELMKQMEKNITLRKAIENDEFLLHYQPIVSLETGRIIGHEALLRWSPHEGEGIISAYEFINLLETTNLLIPLNEWALKEACRQTVKWQENIQSLPHLHISVNFPAKLFTNSKIVKLIHDVLEETKLPPNSLWIEITEEINLDINQITLNILNQVKELGVQISLDDFGTGYSALNYLIDLPFDTLKIDKSIIGRIDSEEKSHKITQSVVSLAKQFELEIVAEGIENLNQLAILKSIGCHYGQGYLFSKAIMADEAEKLLKESMFRYDLVVDNANLL